MLEPALLAMLGIVGLAAGTVDAVAGGGDEAHEGNPGAMGASRDPLSMRKGVIF